MSRARAIQRLLRDLPWRLSTLWERRESLFERYVRPWVLRLRVEHLAGPQVIPYGEDEVLATCILRNGETHLRSFLEHHIRLGVSHFVLLDNGSTDRTVEIARLYANVTVLRTRCPYHKYENTMKRYLARRFSYNRWNLFVDIDERFDYPGSDSLPLPAVLRYLNRHGYTAVVAHMLDMFPDCRLADLDRVDGHSLDEAHSYYDTSNIRRTDYVWGTSSNPSIRMYWNGIRNTIFGTEQGLTKAPLVFVAEGLDLFVDWHHVPGARLADFTALLLHYPFAGSFHSKVKDAVETNRYGGFSVKDYAKFWETLVRSPEASFRQPTSRRWRGADALVDEGFLVASRKYRQWVDAQRQQSGSSAAAPEVTSGR